MFPFLKKDIFKKIQSNNMCIRFTDPDPSSEMIQKGKNTFLRESRDLYGQYISFIN